MGLKQWRQRRSMTDPVRGEFRPTGSYDAHPHIDIDFREIMTGVVTGPGVVATAGEVIQDKRGKWVGHDTLPALIDRANPTDFQILWDEVGTLDQQTIARDSATRAAHEMQAGPTAGPPPGDSPEWARGLVADLAARGVIPGVDSSLDGVTIDAPEVRIEVNGPPATGQPGTAVLRGVTDIPLAAGSIPFPGGSFCTLALDVNGPAGAYPVQTRLGFRSPKTRAAIAVPGKVLPVRIDPSDPQHVTVDVAEFYKQNPGLAL